MHGQPRISALTIAFVLVLPTLPGCQFLCPLFCPRPEAAVVVQFSLVTPEATFYSFKRALEADSPDYEWKCISYRTKSEQKIDRQKYAIGRSYFLRKYKKEIAAFKRSSIIDVVPVQHPNLPEGRVVDVVLSDGTLAGAFRLINEPYWQVDLRSDDFEEPDERFDDLEEGAEIRDHYELRDGELHVRIPLPRRPRIDLEEIVGAELKNEWKVLEFVGMSEALAAEVKKRSQTENPQP